MPAERAVRRRDTHKLVSMLLAFWVFALARPTLMVLVGRASGLGKMLDLADHPVIAVMVVCTALGWAARNPSIRISIWLPALGFTFAGILSAVLHGVGLVPMAIGGWSDVKLWALLFVTAQMKWSPHDVERLERVLRWSVYAVSVGVIANATAPVTFRQVLAAGDQQVTRAGFGALQSFFTHPAGLASFAGVGFAVYLARFVRGGDPRDRFLLLLCLGCGIVSLELKALLVPAAALGAALLAAPRTTARRLSGVALAGVIVLGLGAGVVLAQLVGTQANRYLGSNDTVRYQLYQASFAMGKANFPLGEGFGRFGSGAAIRYYSPVYEKYGLSSKGGLTEGAAVAAHDTTWPTVLGETGYLGLVFFAGGVLGLLITALRRARAVSRGVVPPWLDLAGVTLLGGLLAESLGKSSFFTLYTALVVALLVGASLSLKSSQPAATGQQLLPAKISARGRRSW